LLRLLRVGAVLAGMALLVPVLPLLGPPARRRMLAGRARAVLRAVRVSVVVRGAPVKDRTLLVANHVSWVDSLLLLADERIRPLSKVEVRGWPVIGRLATLAGTIYIDRDRPRELPATVARVRAALAAGDVVAVFPEGTTTCGRSTVRFRPAMFQAAIDAGAAVVPVRLRYLRPEGTQTTAPAFIGPETLLESVRRVLALGGCQVLVDTGTAIHPEPGARRAHLAGLARTAVAWEDWKPGRATSGYPQPAGCPSASVGSQRPAVSRTAPVPERLAA
jgi:1-acyl-sn-glycerol-3-phosphate acyltransferase